MKKWKTILILISLVIISCPPAEIYSRESSGSNSLVYLHLGIPTLSSIDGSTASREGTGTSGKGFQLGLGNNFFRFFNIGGDMGLDYFDDKAEFTQSTTSGEMTTTIIVPYVSLFAGLRTPAIYFSAESNGCFSLGVNAGRTWVFNAKRTVDGCSGCAEEKLDIESGYFIEPEIAVYYDIGMKLGIGFSYRHFIMESDYERLFMLKILVMGNH